jgi:CDP-diacylglycerol--glycerol-3-phosphate 3-phosphatidyltransferase
VLLWLGLSPGLWTTSVLAVMLVLAAVTVWNRAPRAVAEAAR